MRQDRIVRESTITNHTERITNADPYCEDD